MTTETWHRTGATMRARRQLQRRFRVDEDCRRYERRWFMGDRGAAAPTCITAHVLLPNDACSRRRHCERSLSGRQTMIMRDTFLGDWWSSRVVRRRVDDVVGDRNRKRTAADSPTSTIQPRRRSGGTGCGLCRGSTGPDTQEYNTPSIPCQLQRNELRSKSTGCAGC